MSAEPHATDPDVTPVALRSADRSGLAATGCATPVLSWRLATSRAEVIQRGYELQIAADEDFHSLTGGSGYVASAAPFGAVWPGPALRSRQVVWCRVRVWTERGVTGWSAPLQIEAALLEAEDWVARPISPASNVGRAAPGPAILLRRAFHLDRPVAQARLYVTALGVHDTALNGRRVSDALLEPGWTAYGRRLLYAAHDVTGLLSPGENVLSAVVGDGWWRGNLTWMQRRAVYGPTTALMAQLEVEFVDGGRLVIATDHKWRGGYGAIQRADLYDGVEVDLRREPAGWRTAGFDDAQWEPVEALDRSPGLEVRSAPPVRALEVLRPTLARTAWGALQADTGQNLTGWLRLRVRGPAGATVRVRHAEVLDDQGRLYTAALRDAKATDTYVLAGDEPCLLEPSFTFHGFRYAEIETSADVTVEDVEVVIVASDLATTGQFSCSDPRLEHLFRNVVWSQRGNFLALPTDCPQRDERMGWTGDIQVFAETACANADADTFLASWLADLALEQRADGCVPSTVPNVIVDHPFAWGAVGWGDAATVVPWRLYEAYGDAATLARQYPSMRRWVDWCASRVGDDALWTGDFQLGDWLDPGAPPGRPFEATTSPDFIANAYLSFSAGLVAKAAAVLGHDQDARTYAALSRRFADAAWARWGEAALTTQAGCAIAIELGIAPEAELQRACDALAALVEQAEGRIATGFLGTPLVLPALARGGHVETAYRLLLNPHCPGWLYQVLQGGTTMWERWDAIRADGSIHAGEIDTADGSSMMSFNHYAYGAVAAWLYRRVAGLSPASPGYSLIRFAPLPGGGLSHAAAAIETPYGRAAISWVRAGRDLSVELEVPPGARAEFDPPPRWRRIDAHAESAFGSGHWRLRLEAG
jgi:alpha-L-rhamnosidase